MATDLKRVPSVSVAPRTGSRQRRTPRHNWHIQFKPFQLQPMMIAPVNAGDSLKNLRFEARVLTDPIVDQITGWWAEMYFFYVRVSDLDEADAARRLVITPSDNLSGLDTSARAWTYHESGSPDWLFMAMKPIVRQYFRKEGGDWSDYTIDSVPGAGVIGKSWLDQLQLTSALPVAPGAIDDYNDRWEIYEQLRKQKLISMDFPEYLRQQGIDVPDQLVEPLAEKRRPELLRFIRQFAYPSNTVSPEVDTNVVSAVSWVVNERMDRPIYCDEPGFIVGLTCVRPKLYRTGQRSTAVGNLRDARTWLPDLLADAPSEALDRRSTGGGSITTSADYVSDLSAIYTLGDQFILGDNVPGTVLPNATTLQSVYPVTADIEDLFASPPTEEPEFAGRISCFSDGTATLTVVGRKVQATV